MRANNQHAQRTGLVRKRTRSERKEMAQKVSAELNPATTITNLQAKKIRRRFAKGIWDKDFIMKKYKLKGGALKNLLTFRSFTTVKSKKGIKEKCLSRLDSERKPRGRPPKVKKLNGRLVK